MARLIVVEGPDKVGKETQSKLLVSRLAALGFKVVRVEPTKESHPKGRKLIYSMLESGSAKTHPNTFQFVQFLNRMYFQIFRLPKFMRSHDLVILDRWALSGYVYGRCEGINRVLNGLMYRLAKRADIVLVLAGNSYQRQGPDDSYEKDSSLQQRVRAQYLIAANHRNNHVRIDNTWSIAEVNDDMLAALQGAGIIK